MERLKAIAAAILLFAIADSAYLTAEHFGTIPLVCPNSGVVSCATVLSSRYSVVFGIPLAVAGLAWAAVMLLLLYSRSRTAEAFAPVWYMLGIAGVAYSLTSQYLLRHICIYCTALDAAIILFLAIALIARNALHKVT